MISTLRMLPLWRAITPVSSCRIPGPESAVISMPVFIVMVGLYEMGGFVKKLSGLKTARRHEWRPHNVAAQHDVAAQHNAAARH